MRVEDLKRFDYRISEYHVIDHPFGVLALGYTPLRYVLAEQFTKFYLQGHFQYCLRDARTEELHFLLSPILHHDGHVPILWSVLRPYTDFVRAED